MEPRTVSGLARKPVVDPYGTMTTRDTTSIGSLSHDRAVGLDDVRFRMLTPRNQALHGPPRPRVGRQPRALKARGNSHER